MTKVAVLLTPETALQVFRLIPNGYLLNQRSLEAALEYHDALKLAGVVPIDAGVVPADASEDEEEAPGYADPR